MPPIQEPAAECGSEGNLGCGDPGWRGAVVRVGEPCLPGSNQLVSRNRAVSGLNPIPNLPVGLEVPGPWVAGFASPFYCRWSGADEEPDIQVAEK